MSEHSHTLRAKILFVITFLISIGSLVWVLQGANLGELRGEVWQLEWNWVALALVSDIAVYVCQAWRWSLVLRPVKPVGFKHSVQAIYVGLFANEVIPLRAGEVIRCFLLSRWTEIPLSVTLASALIERIFDGFWLVVCLLVTIKFVALPQWIVDGGFVLGALVLIAGALLAVAMFWRQQALDRFLGARWFHWVHVLIEDLHLIGHSRYLYFAALASLPYLLIQTIPIYALMKAYGFLEDDSIRAAFTVMVIVRLGSVLPQAPGNIGTFQVLSTLAVQLFGTPNAVAKRFSLILWAVVTVPLLLAGFIALAITEMDMGDIHREARAGMRERRRRHVQTYNPRS